MVLTEEEAKAINDFLGENWTLFLAVAKCHLTEKEVDALGDKLSEA